MKKLVTIFLGILLGVSSVLVYSVIKSEAEAQNKTANFKVMGYFSESPFNAPIDESVQFEGLTHLIYAFVKTNADGSIVTVKKPDRLKELVQKSHAHNVKVIIAVGGIYNGTQRAVYQFETMAASEEATKRFVKEMETFIDTYQVDGIEIDWEYPSEASKDNYEKLMVSLREMLTAKGKTLSVAVAGAASVDTKAPSVTSLSDTSLACMDWVDIMAYDLGSGLNGQQSPFWFADVSIDYYLKRNVPAEKIILGLPLFARPSWKQYRDLVAMNKENAYIDYVATEKLPSYYNGINTIAEKTRLALNHAGGIMFFDINEDTHDETSAQKAALDMIDRYEKYELKDLFIVVNNHEMVFDNTLGKPYIDQNGRVMVPVRAALEPLGAVLNFDSASAVVTIQKDQTVISQKIGDKILIVNGIEKKLDTFSAIKNGRLYLPLRAVYENFGYSVTYHNDSQSILISGK